MVKENIYKVRKELPEGVSLVAVSKYHPMEAVQEAYDCGQRIFGESIVKDLCQKYEALPKDIEWHFIGHLQTNKVKYIAPFISMIESVDSEHLLAEIDKQAAKCGRIIDVLLELHLAKEETKNGYQAPPSPPRRKGCLFDSGQSVDVAEMIARYPHVRLRGIMAMATNTDDKEQIAQEFDQATALFNELKSLTPDPSLFTIRSWGMSGDYKIAVKYGSNEVRIGSKIFN